MTESTLAARMRERYPAMSLQRRREKNGESAASSDRGVSPSIASSGARSTLADSMRAKCAPAFGAARTLAGA